MNLDTYMDDFGRDLKRAAARRRSRRRLARRALLPAVPVGAALAVAITALPGGVGDVDAIAAAREALAPDGEIVHMTVRFKTKGAPAGPGIEQWYAADPVRWRTRTILPQGRRAVPRMMDRHGRITGRLETAFSGGRMRLYVEARDTVTISRGERYRPAAGGPSLFGGDPATDLRAQLSKGGVRDEGVVTAQGKRVRRLVRENTHRNSTARFVYYVDPDTFAPVGGLVTHQRRNGPLMHGPEFMVSGYERIPLNEQTEHLLEIEKTPETKYVWR
jgi:hypothetical protein